MTVPVTFEPTRLGEFQGAVTLSSKDGGDYVFPVIGHCTPPVPVGPIVVRGSTAVPFKNVLGQQTFEIAIDNPNFSVAKASEVIPAGKTTAFSVTYKPDGQAGKASAPDSARGKKGGKGKDKAGDADASRPVVLDSTSNKAKMVVRAAEDNFVWTFYLDGDA